MGHLPRRQGQALADRRHDGLIAAAAFYPVTHAMMHARVATDGDLTVGTPERLFDAAAYVGFEIGAPGAWYDVTADGQRFLMLRPVDDTASSPPQLILVQNWFDELRRLVPVK